MTRQEALRAFLNECAIRNQPAWWKSGEAKLWPSVEELECTGWRVVVTNDVSHLWGLATGGCLTFTPHQSMRVGFERVSIDWDRWHRVLVVFDRVRSPA